MFSYFFSKPASTKKLTNAEEKQLFELDKPLLTAEQSEAVWAIISKVTHTPITIKKSSKVPFNILYDGVNVYVISNLLLGQGGSGKVIAAQELSKTNLPVWVAVKESLNNQNIYKMMHDYINYTEDRFLRVWHSVLVQIFITDLKKQSSSLVDDYESGYFEPNNEQLINCFLKISNTLKQETFDEMTLEAIAIKEIKDIDVNVFSDENFIYQVMPVIKGHDLYLLSEDSSRIEFQNVYDQIKRDAITDIDHAQVKWGPFVQNSVHLVLNILHEIHHLHSKNYLHRDIKPNNIMLDELGKIKLIDFGTAVKMENGEYVGGPAGSVNYQSPELAAHIQLTTTQPYLYSPADDLYSLGVTLREMLANDLGEVLGALYPTTQVIQSQSEIGNLFHSIKMLADTDPHIRLKAMSHLIHYFPWLIKAVDLENGLILQHSDKREKLIEMIDYYRSLVQDSPFATECKVQITINGLEIPMTKSRQILLSSLSNEQIADNLLLIKQSHQDFSLSTEELISLIQEKSSFTNEGIRNFTSNLL